MTQYTIDVHQPPARSASGPRVVDGRRLGAMALAMRSLASRRGPYLAPTISEYFAY
jgi:hypothetical protein